LGACLALLVATAVGFVVPCRGVLCEHGLRSRGVARMAAKGKGFGKPVEKPPPRNPTQPRAEAIGDEDLGSAETPSRGADALEELRLQSERKGMEVQRRLEDMKEVEKVLRENPDAGVIPEVVAQRMLGRMLPLAAVPIFGGIALFVGFYIAATKWDLEIQPTVVAYATTAPWLLGLAGLTYGILSASWDPEVEGSFLGTEEVKLNLSRIADGLRRAGENERLREFDRTQGGRRDKD